MSEEDKLQSECVKWFRYQYPKLKKLLFHVPNGGSRNVIEAKKLKQMSVVPGVSDLILLLPRRNYGALCIEMKTPSGDQSPSQKEWEQEVTVAGNKYALCRSFEEFQQTINDYLS